MDWESNLAAIIKHTDANLKQQFRQFDDLGVLAHPPPPSTYEFASTAFGGRTTAVQSQPQPTPDTSNFAHAFLRDTMATLRSGGSGSNTAATMPTSSSFAQHFREQQDRKKHLQHTQQQQPLSYENNRPAASDDGASDYDDAGYEQPQYHQAPHPTASRAHRRSRGNGNNAGLGFQMYTSPTYDVAQMMEQVRLSLKLEVDARAAIAERQLSALLQLCKASGEELDRLRVEVCAADRQLHTLDQVQAKMRQELTTQKDIGFHLQSMCGKDESWRMQAENQLLEMRQLVAALREQGNAVQLHVQEKLSRSELLVQFNAAIEPIKAQFQATLQHQAHQLAEITRSSSSSALLLDALTQKLNRVQADEIVALRNDLQALKIHVSRMGALDGSSRLPEQDDDDDDDHHDDDDGGGESRKPSRRTAAQRARTKAIATAKQRDDHLKREIVDVLLPQAVLPLIQHELDKSVRPQLTVVDKEMLALQQNVQSLTRAVEETATTCQRQASAAVATAESSLKQVDQQLRSELATQLRVLSEKHDQSHAQLTALVETRAVTLQTKHNDVVKVVETEHNSRKTALDALHEELRRARHAWEEQLHVVNCEQRTKATALGDEWSQRLRELERKWTEIVETTAKQTARHAESTWTKAKHDVDARVERMNALARTTTDTIAKLEKAVATVAQDTAALATKIKALENVDTDEDEPRRLTRRGSAGAATVGAAVNNEATTTGQLASIDALLQKMMVQMQLQMQHQQQQMAMAAQSAAAAAMPQAVFGGPYWPATTMVHPTHAALPLPPPSHTPVAPTTVAPSSATSDMSGSRAVSASRPPPTEVAATSTDASSSGPATATPPPSSATPANDKTVKATTVVDERPPPPDASIDDIISRAITDELASPAKPLTIREPAAAAVTVSDTTKPTPQAVASTSSDASMSPVTSTLRHATPAMPTAAVDPTAKAQQTLASTVRGATSEAEMAKQRIEARRKQDQDARLQTGAVSSVASVAPPPLTRASSTSSLLGTETSPPTKPTAPTPALARSHSVSNLTQPTTAPPVARPSPIQTTTVTTTTTTTTPPPPPPRSAPVTTTPGTISRPLPIGNEARTPTATTTMPPPSSEGKPPTPKPASVPPPQQQITHVLCDQCRLPVRSDLLTEHMLRQCIKRTVGCNKCLSKFPWHEVDAHQRDCHGPTSSGAVPAAVPPPPPPRPVALSTVTQSESSTEATGVAATQLKKCRHCSADVATTELFDHELKCDQVLKQCPHCLRRQKVAELQDHIENCDCRLVSCPNDCGGKFLQRGLDKHLSTRCPKRSVPTASATPSVPTTGTTATALPVSPSAGSAGPVTAPPPPPSAPARSTTTMAPVMAPPPKPDTGKLEKVECKFCDEEFTVREIETHENSCDWKPRRCQHCNMVIISRDLARHESSCKTSTKPCPHCHETMVPSALPAHTSRCSKRPIKCIRCCQLFPADAIVAHSSSCKFIPSAASAASAASMTSSVSSTAVAAVAGTASASVPPKIPPPPPYPPTTTTVTSAAAAAAKPPVTSGVDESAADRIARRNLALSQLTHQPVAAAAASSQLSSGATRAQASAVARPEVDDDDHAIDDDDEEDEEEEEEEDQEEDEDEDQLTLAQVVAEWSVENVCLWLHEDVGVPDVVPRFQQRRCNGEMLLELTESDLINDYGIKNRIHRERILSAIDAIKTSDDFSDEEEEEDEEEEDGEEDEDEDEDDQHETMAGVSRTQIHQPRASMSRLELSDALAPRDLLRRNSLPSPQPSPTRVAGGPLSSASALPSSSAMLRRINSALNVEFPSTSSSRPTR